MAKITYFVVIPFEIDERGRAAPRDAIQAQNAGHALRLAERLAAKGGAIAFSRSGNPQLGEFDDAEVLAIYGTVPGEAVEAIAA
jgi:hypothetical protein